MANTNMDIILDPRRNQAADRKKLYEEMLLKEMPGIDFMHYTIGSPMLWLPAHRHMWRRQP